MAECKEGTIEIAKKMLANILALETISKYTELPLETIESLRDKGN